MEQPRNKRYVCCLCRPQYVNGNPTGPSVPYHASSPTAAAMKLLVDSNWDEPGYIEVLVYMDPNEQDPKAGSSWRVRVALEPER